MLFGENGIINQSQNASSEADKAEEQEAINLATIQATSRSKNSIEKSILETALKDNITDKEYTLTGDSEPYKVTFTESGRTYTITSDGATEYLPESVAGKKYETENYIIKDEDELNEKISELGYVGYYADIDNNGTVDGIIYADLAVAVSGEWSSSFDESRTFSYDKVGDLKDYTISSWTYKGQTTAGVYEANDIWGEKEVIVPAKNSSGANDRFYVIALENYDSNYYYWFYNYECDFVTSEDFGTGKENTKAVISVFNDFGNEILNNNFDLARTVWSIFKGNNLVETKYPVDPNVWFVPSREEWCAICVNLGVIADCYSDLDFCDFYWSSTQGNTYGAYLANFKGGCIDYYINYYYDYGSVRLSATF